MDAVRIRESLQGNEEPRGRGGVLTDTSVAELMEVPLMSHVRRLPFVLLVGLVGVLSLAVLATFDARAGSFEQREVARIRRHLSGAEELMARRDVSTLTPEQRSSREARIADLEAYRLRGVFPHNHQHPDDLTPVFVDEHGTRCAMAYLIERSGADSLVRRIATTENLARIRELANDRELVAWLERNGISLDEAAQIQPEYGWGESESESDRETLAAIGLGAGGLGVGLNLGRSDSPSGRSLRGLTGIGCGLFSFAAGATQVNGTESTVVGLNIVVGIASFFLGTRQLVGKPPEKVMASSVTVTPASWRDRDGVQRYAMVARF